MNSIEWMDGWVPYLWTPKKGKTFNHHGLLINLSEKINLKRSDKYDIYAWKNIKNLDKNNNV